MKQEIEVNGEKVVIESGISSISLKNESLYLVTIDNGAHEVFVLPEGSISDGNSLDGLELNVPSERDALIAKYFSEIGSNGSGTTGNKTHLVIKAPMPGLVKNIFVNVGDEVTKTTQVLILEAMKMENSIHAPSDGTITAIKAEVGDNVEKNQILIELSQ